MNIKIQLHLLYGSVNLSLTWQNLYSSYSDLGDKTGMFRETS